MEDRADNLLANDSQAPDRRYEAALALDADGRFLSLRDRRRRRLRRLLPVRRRRQHEPDGADHRPVRDRHRASTAVKAVLTNKNQQGVFRGAGSEVAQLGARAARRRARPQELGIDGIELRRRNLIQPDQFPYKIPTGNVYDSGDYPAVLDKALAHAELDFWRAEQARARERGPLHRHRARAGPAALDLRLDRVLVPQPGPVRRHVDDAGERADRDRPDRRRQRDDVLAVLGQLARDGRRPARRRGAAASRPRTISIAYDSTAHGLPSAGPGGSRHDRDALRRGARRGAARCARRCSRSPRTRSRPARRTWSSSTACVRVRGVADESRAMSIADIGMKAYWYKDDLPEGMESGLEGSFTYDHPYTTLPSDDRTDLGVVLSDDGPRRARRGRRGRRPTPARCTFLKFLAVHDVGTVVNPRSLRGPDPRRDRDGDRRHADGADPPRRRGPRALGLVRGLPAAAGRRRAQRRGRCTTRRRRRSPSTASRAAARAGGWSRRRAITTAVEDALAPFGVRIDALPITPEQIVEWATDEARPRRADDLRPDAARAFYVGVLGLEEVPRPPTFTFPGLWVAIGDRQLHLIGEAEPGRARETHPATTAPRSSRPATRATSRSTSRTSTAFLGRRARARRRRRRRARARAATASCRPTSTDPDGNVVELMQTGVAVTGDEPEIGVPQKG